MLFVPQVSALPLHPSYCIHNRAALDVNRMCLPSCVRGLEGATKGWCMATMILPELSPISFAVTFKLSLGASRRGLEGTTAETSREVGQT